MLEAVEHIGTETDVIVLILLVGDVLDEHRRVEVDQRSGEALTTIFCEVYRSEGTIRTVALTHHWCATPATAVGIEPVGLLARSTVGGADKVGGIHRVPLSVDKPCEDRTFVTPLGEILYRCRPCADVRTAVGRVVYIVRADDVGAQLAGVVRILKHTGFAIGHMLPQREVRVLSVDSHCRTRQETEKKKSFHY